MMGWPQVTYIALLAASVGIALVKHGEPRKPWDAWDHVLGAALTAFLLYAGGFFG